MRNGPGCGSNQSRHKWAVVKECCDNGCWLVVLVRTTDTGRVVAYCYDCRDTWDTPQDLAYNNWGKYPAEIDKPTRAEIEKSIWAGAVVEFVTDEAFSTVEEINRDLQDLAEGRIVTPTERSPERLRRTLLRWLGAGC